MTPIRPYFSYYGGKWSIARRFPAPVHDHIVEPFAGSAGYSVWHLANQPVRAVTLVDSYEPVVATWRYLVSARADEIAQLPLLEPGQKTSDLPVCQEIRWLIGWWVNKGSAQPKLSLSKWAASGYQAYQYWGPEIRARLAAQVDHIRHWKIIHGQWWDAPDVEATWFVDPPYVGEVGGRYPHREVDYPKLAGWCRERRGQVMVCENVGADWLPFTPLVEMKGTIDPTTGKRRTSKEAAWFQ